MEWEWESAYRFAPLAEWVSEHRLASRASGHSLLSWLYNTTYPELFFLRGDGLLERVSRIDGLHGIAR